MARRKLFNSLVVDINEAIREVVHDVSNEVDYKIGFSDWDPWPREGVKGQMCDPSSTGRYPDSKQPDLQFFKPDTYIAQSHDDLRKRDDITQSVADVESTHVVHDKIDHIIYDSILWKSRNPHAAVLHKLDKRAPSPPGCPSDRDWKDPDVGMGRADTYGKLFHPNEVGHNTIASFAIAKAIDLRAEVLGVGGQTCEITNESKCWRKEGRRNSYASAERLNENYKDFCNSVQRPSNTVGWKFEKTYHRGTPDEHTLSLQLGDRTSDWDKDNCLESMRSIINDCDSNDSDNPLKWKFGGRRKSGEYTYEVNIARRNRPWPLSKTYGRCKGNYKFAFSSYTLYGKSPLGHDLSPSQPY